MRILAIIFVLIIGVACSGSQIKTATHWSPSPTGTQIFTIRINAPLSLSDYPNLSAEIQCGDAWERVALESPYDQPGAAAALIEKLEENPLEPSLIKGTLLSRTVPWGQGHHSRVLVVLDIDVQKPQTANESTLQKVE